MDDDKNVTVLSAKLHALHQDVGEIKMALGSLTDAITKLALIEERQSVTSNAINRMFASVEKIEARVAQLERDVPLNRQKNVWLDRFVTAFIVGAAAFIWESVKKGG